MAQSGGPGQDGVLDLIYPWTASERGRLHALADGYDWSQNKRSVDFLDHQHEVRQGCSRLPRTLPRLFSRARPARTTEA